MYQSIPSLFNHRKYTFLSWLGVLRSVPDLRPEESVTFRSQKQEETYSIVLNPYLAEPTDPVNCADAHYPRWIRLYARLLVWSHKRCYPLLWLFSHLRMNRFENSDEAITAFCRVIHQKQQLLCMPRSVFAATTSREFKKSGAMFIGVFHPSRHMHAWIIENGHNPCRFDNIWINFKPVCMMI